MVLSPLLGWNCRFEPACSQYMTAALTVHGLLRGSLLGVRRLLRCHPFSKGGYDPVPRSDVRPRKNHRQGQNEGLT